MRPPRRSVSVAALAITAGVWAAPSAAQSPGAGGPPPFPSAAGSWSLAGPIRDLPSSGNVWSLVETADPFAIVDRLDAGGLYGAEPARVGAHGASWTQTRFRFGDLDVSDPAGAGAPLLYPDLDALESVRVTSALAPVELGGAGPTIVLVPRRPGPAWRASFGAAANGAGPQPDAGAPAIARYGSWAGGHALVSGPLVKDRVGLLVAGAVTRWRRLERSDPVPIGGDLGSLLVHVVLTPRAADEIRVLGLVQGRRAPYAGRALFASRDVSEDDNFWHLQGTWARHLARGAAWTVTAGYQRGVFVPLAGASAAGGAAERLTDGSVLALASAEAGVRERWDARFTFTPDLSRVAGGRHAARAGVGVTLAHGSFWLVAPTWVGETVGGLPARAWRVRSGFVSRRRATTLAAYAADRVRVSSHVRIEAGLRLEISRGSADAASRGLRWAALSPRLSARWDVDGSGATGVFGGLAIYRQPLSLDVLAAGGSPSLCAAVSRWRDANGDGLVEPAEVGAPVTRVGPGCAGRDPDLKPPSTREVVLGVEHRLGGRFVVRLAGIDRRERNLIGFVNEGATAGDYTVRFVPDPGTDYVGGTTPQLLPVYDRDSGAFRHDAYLLTNPAGSRARYQGVELTFETAPGGPLWMQVGATAYRAEGPGADVGFGAMENDQGALTASLDGPNAATNAVGRLFFDRAYVIKWATTWHAPHDVRVGVAARYQDGQPFARVVVAPDLTQGAEAVQAYPRGETRFTYTFTLDARLEKGFSVAGRRVAAVLEAFNLLGTSNEVEENVVSGPSFRAVTAVQPPRVVRLGVRVDF